MARRRVVEDKPVDENEAIVVTEEQNADAIQATEEMIETEKLNEEVPTVEVSVVETVKEPVVVKPTKKIVKKLTDMNDFLM